MPLARTPPPNAPAVAATSHRPDTFSPSQAFLPGGTVQRSPVNPNSTSARTPARTPSRPHPTTSATPGTASRPHPNDNEIMVIDAPEGEESVEPPQGEEEATEDVEMNADEEDDDDEMDVEAAIAEPTTPRVAQPEPQPQPSSSRPRQSIALQPLPTPGPSTAQPEAQSEPTPSSQPQTQPQSSAPITPARPARTPKAKTKTPAEVLAEPAVPIEDDGEANYGRYYEALVRALRINAVDRGLGRWAPEDMKQCYPLLEALNPNLMKQVWARSSYVLRKEVLDGALEKLDEYRTGPSLQLLAETVDEARAYAASNPGKPRPDAWRPDLEPAAVTAATNLQTYDDAWTRLRTEFIELQTTCRDRVKSIAEKQEQLSSVETGVSTGVVELEKAIKLLDGSPSEDMLAWVEDVESKMVTR